MVETEKKDFEEGYETEYEYEEKKKSGKKDKVDEDEETLGRYEFEIEESVAEFEDEEPTERNQIPESSDDSSEDEIDVCEKRMKRRISHDRLALGSSYYTLYEFKEVILEYALSKRKNIKQDRWDKTKVSFVCGIGKKCKWRIYCSYDTENHKWLLKTKYKFHSCTPDGKCKLLKSTVIARLFLDKLRQKADLMPEGKKMRLSCSLSMDSSLCSSSLSLSLSLFLVIVVVSLCSRRRRHSMFPSSSCLSVPVAVVSLCSRRRGVSPCSCRHATDKHNANMRVSQQSNRFITSRDVKMGLGRIPTLAISLNLSCNSFAGAIPSRFSSLVNLGTLDISHNKLAGNLNVLGSWLNLVSLNISFNEFSCELPNVLADLQNRTEDSLSPPDPITITMDEFVDMNEEDALAEINLEATQLEEQQSETHSGESAQAQRKRRKTSRVWEDFVSVGIENDGKKRARCLHCCMKLVTRNEKNVSCGTHHLQRHLETCPKKPPK
ncbi:LOW QUALITY PROTEIN: hypothetical protein YC2023_037668 [Brassica napus]